MAAFEITRESALGLSVGGRITATFNKALATYTYWRDVRATQHELSKLSEHELADIGLNRGDISRISRGASY